MKLPVVKVSSGVLLLPVWIILKGFLPSCQTCFCAIFSACDLGFPILVQKKKKKKRKINTDNPDWFCS